MHYYILQLNKIKEKEQYKEMIKYSLTKISYKQPLKEKDLWKVTYMGMTRTI